MEVPYIFAILNTIIAGVYVYAHLAFNLADAGSAFLSNLAFKQPEKLNHDPLVLNSIKNRDLPNMQNFAYQRNRVKSLLAAAIIINFVNYVLYPYDALLYSWMEYILQGAAVIMSADAILMFFRLHKNKYNVNTICNAYDDIVMKNAQDKQIEKTDIAIDEAFDSMMKDSSKGKNKNEDDET